MKITIDFPVPHQEEEFAEVINTLATWLEASKKPPDHWDIGMQSRFYNIVVMYLGYEARVMISKLFSRIEPI